MTSNRYQDPLNIPKLERRKILAGMGIAGAGLLLRSLRIGEAHAAANVPRRVIFLTMGHGTLRPAWNPVGVGGGQPTEASFNLPAMHQSLAPFKSKLNMIAGLDFKGYYSYKAISGDGHDGGQIYALTNGKPAGQNSNRADRASVDYLISKAINSPTPVTNLPALYMMIQGENSNGSRFNFDSTNSFSGSNERIPYEASSKRIFDALFPYGQTPKEDVGTGESPVDREIRKRKSVLDFMASEYTQLGNRMSSIERTKLDQHAQAIRDLEARLALAGSGGNSIPNGCLTVDTAKLKAIGTTQSDSATTVQSYLLESEIRMRLAVAALSCDATRVISMAVANPPGLLFGFDQAKPIGERAGADNQHDLQHDWSDSTSGAGYQMLLKEKTMQSEQIAQLLGLLDEVVESDGRTLLDHTAVVCLNELANGNHDHKDHRFIVAGSLGGYLKTGRYLKLSNTSHADVLTAVANGMGLNVDKIGVPELTNGALGALLA